MKAFLVLFAVLAATAAVLLSENEEQQWQNFKRTYGKEYNSQNEEDLRKQIFAQNLHKFRNHNEKYEKGLVSYTIGVNQFADMTNDEFKKTLPALDLSDIPEGLPFIPRANVKAPDSMDWREKGAVTPVKYQETCGSCYAFSATGAMEGHLFLKNKELVNLSEQNLVDCSKTAGNYGCKGGYPSQCFRYVQYNGGIDTEESYPYENREGDCRYTPENSGGTVNGFVRVNDEKSLLDAVGTVGPISILINGLVLQHYSEGILDGPCDPILSHAVLVVGYGTSEDGKDYWIIKNSWSERWGEDGYIRVIRDQNECGLGPTGVYPIV